MKKILKACAWGVLFLIIIVWVLSMVVRSMFGGAGQPARTVVADSSQAVVEQQPTPEGTRLEITITEAQLTSLLRQQLKQQNNSYFANDTQIVIQKSGIELSGTLLKPINSYVTIGLIPTLTDGQFPIGVGPIKAGSTALPDFIRSLLVDTVLQPQLDAAVEQFSKTGTVEKFELGEGTVTISVLVTNLESP